ncbi:uncharacterized protein LY89DRAFT_676215 [Mollisia scopiformis]|uniref:Uncharacterized protein n=1 Tax=Mollisia scopiformis TaxID=149040 RepID=A0A132BAI9_MOLSC|nr:uncharacterized protein LY89DRAFT_676215 [Mollisia scopiformis]KUJ09422.1 hypothetical protein LY89DRAFT_676215 [Mollisia scopiformis]
MPDFGIFCADKISACPINTFRLNDVNRADTLSACSARMRKIYFIVRRRIVFDEAGELLKIIGFGFHFPTDRLRFYREFRQHQAEKIAFAKAESLAHPRNTTQLVFGPQLYEAPLLCEYPSNPGLIIPQAYCVNLGCDHSITDHQAVIVDDIRPFIWQSVQTQYLEKVYSVKHVDDCLLRAIRSDPKVVLVTCDFYDDNVFENLGSSSEYSRTLPDSAIIVEEIENEDEDTPFCMNFIKSNSLTARLPRM